MIAIEVIDNIGYTYRPKQCISKEEALKYFELYPIKFLCIGKDSSKLYTKEDVLKSRASLWKMDYRSIKDYL